MAEGAFEYDYLLRIILVGDSGIGKSSLLMRYTDKQFQETLLPTIGIDFKTKLVEEQGRNLKLQFWDTAGQERFKTITKNYYRGAHAVIFVYDITDRQSFKRIEYWLSEAEQNLQQEAIKILIGNKSDLKHKREVDFEEGKQLAASLGLEFFEASAKENSNIDSAVNYITKLWVRRTDSKPVHRSPEKKEARVCFKQKKLLQLCQC